MKYRLHEIKCKHLNVLLNTFWQMYSCFTTMSVKRQNILCVCVWFFFLVLLFLFLIFLYLFNYFFISWRLITLQYCSGFCHTLTWISHGFTCAPLPDPPFHLPLCLIPLGLPSAPGLSTCLMHPTWAADLFHPR